MWTSPEFGRIRAQVGRTGSRDRVSRSRPIWAKLSPTATSVGANPADFDRMAKLARNRLSLDRSLDQMLADFGTEVSATSVGAWPEIRGIAPDRANLGSSRHTVGRFRQHRCDVVASISPFWAARGNGREITPEWLSTDTAYREIDPDVVLSMFGQIVGQRQNQ